MHCALDGKTFALLQQNVSLLNEVLYLHMFFITLQGIVLIWFLYAFFQKIAIAYQ